MTACDCEKDRRHDRAEYDVDTGRGAAHEDADALRTTEEGSRHSVAEISGCSVVTQIDHVEAIASRRANFSVEIRSESCCKQPRQPAVVVLASAGSDSVAAGRSTEMPTEQKQHPCPQSTGRNGRQRRKSRRRQKPKTEGLEHLLLSLAGFNGGRNADRSSPEAFLRSYRRTMKRKGKHGALALLDEYSDQAMAKIESLIGR
jgi:hypothetical protein